MAIVQPLRRRKRLAGSAVCRRGAVLGCCHGPRGLQKVSAAGTTRPPSRGRSKPTLGHSHEESSWCSWRPFEPRARADGGGGSCLLHTERQASVRTGVSTEGRLAQGLSRGRSA